MAKSRRNMRKNKNMKGGDYTENQIQILKGLGFSDNQITRLNDLNIGYDQIQAKIADFNGEPDELADFVDNYFLNNEIHENPNAAPIQIIGANEEDSSDEDNNPLNVSDLSIGSRDSGYTTKESGEIGGKKRRRNKTRKNKKYSKSRKTRKSCKRKYVYKQKGGVCFGNGIGANNYDPNFSIYNTRELQLFPYKPTK